MKKNVKTMTEIARNHIKKVKVTIEPCPCCGSENIDCDKYYTSNGAYSFGGYAYIRCKCCNHKVEKEFYNIGWGDTLEGLFNLALAEWNGQAKHDGKSKGKSNVEQDAKILKWVESMRGYDVCTGFQADLDELEKIVVDPNRRSGNDISKAERKIK